jgi:hypothetical protein
MDRTAKVLYAAATVVVDPVLGVRGAVVKAKE